MSKNVHPKMDPSERAKQFLPFSALEGYEEALRKKEREVEARVEAKEISAASDTGSETFRIPYGRP